MTVPEIRTHNKVLLHVKDPSLAPDVFDEALELVRGNCVDWYWIPASDRKDVIPQIGYVAASKKTGPCEYHSGDNPDCAAITLRMWQLWLGWPRKAHAG